MPRVFGRRDQFSAQGHSLKAIAKRLNAEAIPSTLDADRKRSAVLETELSRLTDRVAAGDDFSSLREAIASRDRELQTIRDRVLSAGPDSLEADLSSIRAFVTRKLRDLTGLLYRDVAIGRAWLAEHITEIRMQPAREGDRRYYVASGVVRQPLEWDLLGGKEARAMSGCGGWI